MGQPEKLRFCTVRLRLMLESLVGGPQVTDTVAQLDLSRFVGVIRNLADRAVLVGSGLMFETTEPFEWFGVDADGVFMHADPDAVPASVGATRTASPPSETPLRYWPESEGSPGPRVLDAYVAGLDAELRCRVCGCTNARACADGCCWVRDPAGLGPLCSKCLPGVLEERGEMHVVNRDDDEGG